MQTEPERRRAVVVIVVVVVVVAATTKGNQGPRKMRLIILVLSSEDASGASTGTAVPIDRPTFQPTIRSITVRFQRRSNRLSLHAVYIELSDRAANKAEAVQGAMLSEPITVASRSATRIDGETVFDKLAAEMKLQSQQSSTHARRTPVECQFCLFFAYLNRNQCPKPVLWLHYRCSTYNVAHDGAL